MEKKEEMLNLEYRVACLAIKAVNASLTMKEASERLGITTNRLYEILRRSRIRRKRLSCVIKPQKVTYRDKEGNIYEKDPI